MGYSQGGQRMVETSLHSGHIKNGVFSSMVFPHLAQLIAMMPPNCLGR
jgi:hypothetical protein